MKCVNCGETYIGEQKHSKSSFALCLFGLCKKLEKEEDNWNLVDICVKGVSYDDILYIQNTIKTFIQKINEDVNNSFFSEHDKGLIRKIIQDRVGDL